jgi:hypothetical protein
LTFSHSCYAMACYVEGMDQVLNVAVSLAQTLADNSLYAHLIRLVRKNERKYRKRKTSVCSGHIDIKRRERERKEKILFSRCGEKI